MSKRSPRASKPLSKRTFWYRSSLMEFRNATKSSSAFGESGLGSTDCDHNQNKQQRKDFRTHSPLWLHLRVSLQNPHPELGCLGSSQARQQLSNASLPGQYPKPTRQSTINVTEHTNDKETIEHLNVAFGGQCGWWTVTLRPPMRPNRRSGGDPVTCTQ